MGNTSSALQRPDIKSQEGRRIEGFFPVTEPGGKHPLARLTETTWGLDRAALSTVTVLGAKVCFRSKLLWSYI